MNALLTARDRDILETLLRKVRILSIDQIGRTWWADTCDPKRNARLRMKVLGQARWVELLPVVARPEIPIQRPVYYWNGKTEFPNFGNIAYRLQSRWTQPAQRCLAAIASDRAAAEFGGRGGSVPRLTETTHDLHLSAVYLLKRDVEPREAAKWMCEDLYPERFRGKGTKIPDALILKRSGPKAIEWGGEYPKPRVVEFHEYCARKGYTYELW